jgi:hypothetical protein
MPELIRPSGPYPPGSPEIDRRVHTYREALEEAYTFRVTWNGDDATPTSSGLSA